MQTPQTSDEVAAPSLTARLLSARTLLSFGVAAAIVGVAVWRAPIDWSEAWSRIRHADVRLYVAALGAYYLSFGIRGLRWRILLENAGERCGVGTLSEIITVSFFVNCVVPAKMGDVYRAYLLRRREAVGATKAFGTIIAERLIDLVVLMALLLLAGGISFRNHVPRDLVPYAVAGALLCALGVGVVAMMRAGRGARLLRLLPEAVLLRYESFRAGTLGALGRWPSVIGLTVVVWGLESTRLAFVVFALGYGALMSPAHFLLVALVAALLTTVPFLPGGLGLVEGGMALVLTKVAGVTTAQAVSIALLDRSISYGSLVVLGFVAFAVTHVRSTSRPARQGLVNDAPL